MLGEGWQGGVPVAIPAAAPTIPAVRLAGVRKHWPGQPRPVLDGVDVELPAGTAALVEGANGAGKTTLLRVLTGILAPDAGEVRILGLRPDGAQRREYQRRLGFLSAGAVGLYARLTARQHLALWARLTLVPPGEREARARAALERFGLGDLAGRRADRMSMGQRQRLRLAMTFLPPVRVVLLDEPTTSLDADGRELLRETVATLVAGGGSAVWCAPTGDAEGAPVDRRLVLRDGRLHEA